MKDSNNEVHKQVAIANDMTKRDREKEIELVNQRRENNLAVVGPWKYVIRGPRGDRKIVKKAFYTVNLLNAKWKVLQLEIVAGKKENLYEAQFAWRCLNLKL